MESPLRDTHPVSSWFPPCPWKSSNLWRKADELPDRCYVTSAGIWGSPQESSKELGGGDNPNWACLGMGMAEPPLKTLWEADSQTVGTHCCHQMHPRFMGRPRCLSPAGEEAAAFYREPLTSLVATGGCLNVWDPWTIIKWEAMMVTGVSHEDPGSSACREEASHRVFSHAPCWSR